MRVLKKTMIAKSLALLLVSTNWASAQEALVAEVQSLVSADGTGLSTLLNSPIFSKHLEGRLVELNPSELAELILLAVAEGNSITISTKSATAKASATSCKNRRMHQILNEDTEYGRWYIADRESREYPGLRVGKSLSQGGEVSNIVTYNTSGVHGYTVKLRPSAWDQCQGDPECIRELGRFGTDPIPEKKPKIIQCMGAEITDPKLIDEISGTIEASAKEELETKRQARKIAQYITVNDAIRGETLAQMNLDSGKPKPQKKVELIDGPLKQAFNVFSEATILSNGENQVGQFRNRRDLDVFTDKGGQNRFDDPNASPRQIRHSSSFAVEFVVGRF